MVSQAWDRSCWFWSLQTPLPSNVLVPFQEPVKWQCHLRRALWFWMESQASPSPHFLFLCTIQWFHYSTLTLDCGATRCPKKLLESYLWIVLWHFFHSIVQDWIVIIVWHAGLMWLSFVTDPRWVQGSGLLSIHHQPGLSWMCESVYGALDHLQSTAAGWEVVAGVLLCPPVTRIPSFCESVTFVKNSYGGDGCLISPWALLINVLFHFQSFGWCHVHSLHKWDHSSCSKDSILSCCPLLVAVCGNAGCGQHGESSHSRNAVITSWGAQERT